MCPCFGLLGGFDVARFENTVRSSSNDTLICNGSVVHQNHTLLRFKVHSQCITMARDHTLQHLDEIPPRFPAQVCGSMWQWTRLV